MYQPASSRPNVPQPLSLIALLLLIVSLAEITVRCVRPYLFPPATPGYRRILADSLLRAALIVPPVWLLIARPLRRLALTGCALGRLSPECPEAAAPDFAAPHGLGSLDRAADRVPNPPAGAATALGEGEDARTQATPAGAVPGCAGEKGRDASRSIAGETPPSVPAPAILVKHLRQALDREELLLHYQPKVCLRSGRVTGMEALLRWQSPELGMIGPDHFISLAEQTGLIEPIGEWVLRTACAQNKAWLDAGLPPLTVAVNLSARQFRQQNIADLIGLALRETGLDPRYLEIEITESMVMQDLERATATLNELKCMGTSLAMDDFGTGYSSLSYLKRFPFDKLKIDQSFVRDITCDPDNAAIARAVIAMAHSLRLKVIAEGVETEGQLNYLRAHCCDEMQGFFYSHPLPPEEFAGLIREDRLLPPQLGGRREKTLLLVDDDKNVMSALRRLFLPDGYRVLTAESAAEGFELLANNRVAVVISDQQMPAMNGTEFLSRVRELYPETVRIMLTGHADLHAMSDAINRGAVYKFLNKPWDDDVVRDKVREAFDYCRLQGGASGDG